MRPMAINQAYIGTSCSSIPRSGGGKEIYFDGEMARKDGLFVLDELKGLNPEYLVGG